MKLSKKNTVLLLSTSLFFVLNGCGDGGTTVEEIVQEKKEPTLKTNVKQQGEIDTHGAEDGKTQIEKTEKMPHPMPVATDTTAKATHSGVVLEVLQAAPYVYLKVKENDKELWVAAPKADVVVGAKVTFDEQMLMKNFTSKTLGRTFESVLFASRLNIDTPTEKGKETVASKKDEVMQNTHKNHTVVTQAKVDDTNKSIQTADKKTQTANGTLYTVEQIYTQADDLNNTVISVKGKVVKVSGGIMGRNWIHIQDGTGSIGSNDLLFTSENIATVGDEVTATGTLKTNIDFGYGYAYSVIIENSKFIK